MNNRERKETKVYLHLRNDTNEVFYVGIGIDDRPYKFGRNSHWNNIANKCGYSVKIVAKNLSWKIACKLEIHLIKKYGRKDLGLGNLVNMTNGGDGILGFVCSEETRLKISKATKGENNPMFGKKLSEETGLKISIGNSFPKHSDESKLLMSKNRSGDKNPFFGKNHSEDAKNRMRNNRTGCECSKDTKLKMSSSGKGKKRSELTKSKISLSLIGNSYGIGNKGNLGGTSWNKRKKMSPDTILKRLETRKRNRELKLA